MMLYKTMLLKLIQDRPELCSRLRQEKLMLQTVETLAVNLKTRHDQWKERLTRSHMRSDAKEAVDSAAMELALKEVIGMLPDEAKTAKQRVISLDALIAKIRRQAS